MIDKIKISRVTILSFLTALFMMVYAFMVENGGYLDLDAVNLFRALLSVRALLVWLICFVSFLFFGILGAERVFKYRYAVALCMFVICVVLRINGSSIGYLIKLTGMPDTDVIFGLSRTIRSDEYAVFTPMTWSQYYGDSPFSYFSSIIRATKTDVFIEYGQPIKSLLMVFRPFQLGYLFLPIEYGMSFFWIGRLIALFMVSFEFGRIITDDNRRISVLYALMVSFAPAVQWWFAINGFVEMLFFMQLSIIAFNTYLKSSSILKKTVCALIIAVCAGGYVLSMYPAWMIPLAYVLLVLIVWTYLQNRKKYTFNRKEIIPIAISLLILVLSAIYVYKQSGETIEIISSTVYPGKRNNSGGGDVIRFFNSFNNIWYPFIDGATYENTCESALFISLFPLGIIFYIKYLLSIKKNDLLCTLLLAVSVFLGCYCFVGFPGIISKITMMSMSFSSRAMVILSFNDLLLFVRSVYLCEKHKVAFGRMLSIVFAVILSLIMTVISYRINPAYFRIRMLIVQFLLFGAIVYFISRGLTNEKVRKTGSVLIALTILISGLLVNPIRMGVDSVQNAPVMLEIRELVNNDPDGVWIIEGWGFPLNNLLIMEGAKTINSTNVYPQLELWESVDDGSDDSDIYNRYAHIMINRDNEGLNDEFVLNNPDVFTVSLTDEEICSLGVDYIFTNKLFENNDIYELVYSENDINIYRTNFD
ncbi:MAG: hypothetical protein ILA15_07010 [Clostridiales bacterium]|nr:hypothetical protein [Clostridiales bacterium]